MLICNRSAKKIIICAFSAFLLLFCKGAFCQTLNSSLSMPEMPSVSFPESPAMPKITAPTLGAKFYTPGTVGTNISDKKTSESSAGTQDSGNSAEEKNVAAKNKSAGSANVANALSYLSADDIASLGSNGLFGGVYSLLGNDTAVANRYAANNSNDVLLQSILTQLEDIKAKTEENADAVKKISLPVTTSGAAGSEKKEFNPAILRFFVNGYNIKDTIRTTYFSKKEKDGSFLLTGDRKFTTDGKNRNETFYLLFKSDGNCGTSAGYFVEPQVVQDYKNEYSFLYQLTKKPELKAEKTGNLVSLKYISDEWNMDLLLDIGDD